MGEALDVNEAGQVVGWTWLPTLVQQAFTWSEADGYRRLGTLLGSDTYFAGDSEARGINDDGIVVGWSIAERGHHAVRWSSAEGFTDLTPTASTDTAANAINNLGTIVGVTGSFRDAGLVMAWTREGIEAPLDGAPAGDTWPAAINDLGQVVGRFATGGETHAFFWDPTAGWVDLGSGAAHDLNERGMIAGAVGADPTMQQAVIWEVTPRVQVTALVRTIDRLAADARVLASARVQSHLAKRWLAAGHRRRAAACLDRVAQDLARIERRAPALATVLRSLSTAARGLARQLGSCASRSSEGYGRPTGGVGTNSGAL
jgi:probable HAF family extracellular repeat protein